MIAGGEPFAGESDVQFVPRKPRRNEVDPSGAERRRLGKGTKPQLQ